MSGYLLSLVPKWNVRGLRLQQLREISNEYVQGIHGFLGPMLKVWYPGVLAGLGNISDLQALTGVDVDTPLTQMTGWLSGLGTTLGDRIKSAELPYPPPSDTAPTLVALRFVKPSVLDPSCANSPSARCPRQGQLSTYRWATTAQSKALWGAIGSHGDSGTVRHIVFQPGPEDLYQPTAGTFYLPCSRSLPVVRKIGLALTGFSSSSFPPEPRSLVGNIPNAAPMMFPDAFGIHSFVMDNTDAARSWLHLETVPLVYTNNDYTRVQNQFSGLVQDVRGVSPFTTFVFDIDEATVEGWKLRDAATIDLLFEVEGIRSGSTVAVPNCAGASSTLVPGDEQSAVTVGAGE
jgi:hypothetical protein